MVVAVGKLVNHRLPPMSAWLAPIHIEAPVTWGNSLP